MDEVLTAEEIEARYAPDWVLIVEPQTDEHLKLLAGKVLFHSPDGDAVYAKVTELELTGRIAVHYLGPYPEPFMINL